MKRLLLILAWCTPFFCLAQTAPSSAHMGQITTKKTIHFNESFATKLFQQSRIKAFVNQMNYLMSEPVVGTVATAHKGVSVPVQATVKRQIALRTVASKAVHLGRKLPIKASHPVVAIATTIAPALIEAGFQRAEERLDPDRDWVKSTEGKTIYCGAMPNYHFWFRCMDCYEKRVPCLLADAPSLASHTGYAEYHVTEWRAVDPVTYEIKGMIYQSQMIPFIPAGNDELIDGLVNHFDRVNNDSDLFDQIRKLDPSVVNGTTIFTLTPNSLFQSPPYTNASTGQAEQTQVRTNSVGDPTVETIPRPDLAPNSTEAPSAEPNPVTPEGASKGDREQPPTEITVDLCKENPNVLACADMGVPDGEIPRDKVDIPDVTNESRFNLPKTCPAPVSVQVWGQTLSFSYQPLCDLMRIIEPLMVCFGAITAFFVLSKGN